MDSTGHLTGALEFGTSDALDVDSRFDIGGGRLSLSGSVPLGPEPAAWDLVLEASGLEAVREAREGAPERRLRVDGTARVQTMTASQNPRLYRLIQCFAERSGVPVLLNTSFNLRGEPIVCSPKDAYRCFMRTRMDRLAVGPFWMEKEKQPPLTDVGDGAMALD